MKLDPLSASSSYYPTGTSAAFNLYAQNFFSTGAAGGQAVDALVQAMFQRKLVLRATLQE